MRLIDADAFLKRNYVYADCEFIHPKYQNTLREIVDDEPTIQAPRWVRCEDEMPKERDYYFAFTADAEAFVGEYIPSVDQWWKDDDLILTVTHWMPIEPPREGE